VRGFAVRQRGLRVVTSQRRLEIDLGSKDFSDSFSSTTSPPLHFISSLRFLAFPAGIAVAYSVCLATLVHMNVLDRDLLVSGFTVQLCHIQRLRPARHNTATLFVGTQVHVH
jgi:hypothetical protein